jgi:trehalose 6-phosphate synthase
MADVVCERAGGGDTVLVQDYHFSLLGRMLAERRPDLHTVHFLHTPFAEPAMLAVLPDDISSELLDGMAGYGACGFHCHKWEAGFLSCYSAMGRDLGQVVAPRTFVAPLGLDVDGVRGEAAADGVGVAADALRAEVGGRRVVARADRMEPSKNIVRGMLAFEELLVARPSWRGEVVHVVCAYPSRQGLAEYLAYAADVEHTATRINHAFDGGGDGGGGGGGGWKPIVLSVSDDYARSLAALTLSDVLLINPVRDGMNLVAKEGTLVNTQDGVLVLSREAGAWEELELGGDGALGVNPFDVTGTADALHAALTMSSGERAARAGALRSAVLGRTAADWWADQVAAAQG